MKSFFTKLCCSLLRLLGIAAVGASVTACYGMPYNPPCMYGSPTATLDIAGKVLNENNEPIEGIKITSPYNKYTGEKVLSDKNGSYRIISSAYGMKEDFYIYAEDIDREENGSYKTDSLLVNHDRLIKVNDGDGGWNLGHYQGKDINIKLKAKK